MIEAEIAERGEDTTKEQKLFSSIWEFKHELSNAENVKKCEKCDYYETCKQNIEFT